MDTIKSYLDNMFINLPKTPEVLGAKDELFRMMGDKYNQLRSEGRTENEAIGQVIAEFGDLEKLAPRLGIGQEVNILESAESNEVSMTDEDVQRYLAVTRESSRLIAGGVALILFGVMVLIFLQAIADRGLLAENIAQAIGVGGLLLLVAIAVYMFIMGGMRVDQYENLETKFVRIDPYLRNRIKLQKDEYIPTFGRMIASGVFLMMLGVIMLVTVAILDIADDFVLGLLVVGLLAMIAIAVSLFITSGMKKSTYDKLLNEGDYTRRRKAEANVLEPIAGLYWTLVLGGYLAWSFLGNAWVISWVVWPLAGVLFATISIIVSMTRRHR
ncbi:MAG: permease prefix domain 1-containing protein [Anaerolineaceae bacterium]|nr:permease prefix domain 1-containing protein [Anaerolineaceae bacterium]MDD4042746.1 permease prefix domain 1-containing protein [Anaerolineaceae bacterium]MDD4577847.1 permease prefix domain 1-containing protein [Anaerolineaceae bacterium]